MNLKSDEEFSSNDLKFKMINSNVRIGITDEGIANNTSFITAVKPKPSILVKSRKCDEEERKFIKRRRARHINV
jgi:hypothetical protein